MSQYQPSYDSEIPEDNNPKKMKLWKKIVIGCIITALSLIIPITRRIVIFILPLGRGIDDLIVFGAIGIALLILIFRGIIYAAVSLILWICLIKGFDDEVLEQIQEFRNKFNIKRRKFK